MRIEETSVFIGKVQYLYVSYGTKKPEYLTEKFTLYVCDVERRNEGIIYKVYYYLYVYDMEPRNQCIQRKSVLFMHDVKVRYQCIQLKISTIYIRDAERRN